MDRSRIRLLMLTLAVAVLPAALVSGCGGTSDESSASSDGGGGNLTLVAYSTPEEAYKELIPAFNKTREGKGVGFDQSYASSGEQSRARRGRAAGRRRGVLARAGHDAPGRGRARRRELEPERVRRLRDRVGRGVHGPQGQSEEHPDLGRPDQGGRRGARAEPVHLRRREVEHHGRLRRAARAGQVAPGGQGLHRAALRARVRARQERPRVAADVLEREGRRAARLRERGDPRAAAGRGARLHRPRRRRS